MFQRETGQEHENKSVFSKVGGDVNRLLHRNFIQGPLLIALEGLTPIPMESVKFREVLEGKQQKKNTKIGGELIKLGCG